MRWLRTLWHRHVAPPPSAEAIDQDVRMLDELRRTLAGSGALRDPRIQRDLAKLDRQLEEMRAHRRRVLND